MSSMQVHVTPSTFTKLAGLCVVAAASTVDVSSSVPEIFSDQVEDLSQEILVSLRQTSTFGTHFDPFSRINDEFIANYIDSFEKALEQYDSGEIIKVPRHLQTEDDFLNWLKSV